MKAPFLVISFASVMQVLFNFCEFITDELIVKIGTYVSYWYFEQQSLNDVGLDKCATYLKLKFFAADNSHTQTPCIFVTGLI